MCNGIYMVQEKHALTHFLWHINRYNIVTYLLLPYRTRITISTTIQRQRLHTELYVYK